MPDLLACLATPAPFRAWLMCQSASLAVGKTQSPDECPLARFLRAAGYDDVLVGRWELSFQERLFPLPLWASQFTHQIDMLASQGTAIRRRQALRLLQHSGVTLVA
jgi:arylsulfatase A-like enzyme